MGIPWLLHRFVDGSRRNIDVYLSREVFVGGYGEVPLGLRRPDACGERARRDLRLFRFWR